MYAVMGKSPKCYRRLRTVVNMQPSKTLRTEKLILNCAGSKQVCGIVEENAICRENNLGPALARLPGVEKNAVY